MINLMFVFKLLFRYLDTLHNNEIVGVLFQDYNEHLESQKHIVLKREHHRLTVSPAILYTEKPLIKGIMFALANLSL